jgi:predicted MFS family arabinose efflux permease
MRMSFFAAAVMFLLSNGFIFFIERQPIDHHDPEAPPPKLMSNQRFVILMGVLAFAIFSMYLSQPLTPNFLASVRGLSLSETGIIFTAGALGNSLMSILFSRVPPHRGFLIAQAMVILFALLIWKGVSCGSLCSDIFCLAAFMPGDSYGHGPSP